MKILLINQSVGYLMVDIVNAYSEKYDEVVLLAGSINEYNRTLSKKVKIEKIVKYNKSSIFKRIYTWIFAFIQILYKLKTKYNEYYVIYVTNPPISYFAALFTNNKYSIIEYDIYPDALKNIGIKNTHFIFRIWSAINKKLFKKADYIFTLSNGMKELLSTYVDSDRIKVIYNWSSSEDLKPIDKSYNPFISKYALQNKFVIMYSGNIGYTHNVELLLNIAIRFKSDNSYHFMIIGSGGKKNELLKVAKENNLENCTFLDLQPSDMIKYSLAAADLSVVTLTEETAFVSVPSKTYNILAVGSPLLCIAPKKSEIARLVNEEKCGAIYENIELDDMCEFVKKLKEDKLYYYYLKNNSLKASEKFNYENSKEYVI